MTTPILTVPERRTTALRRNPQSLVIVGPSQCGKTSAVAALPDTLIFELQPGGADYIASCWALTYEKDLPDADSFLRWLDYLYAQRQAGKPIARRIVIDHIAYLDELVWSQALKRFNASPQGRAWQAKRKANGEAEILEVTELPGNPGSQGWKWLRDELSMLKTKIELATSEVIYLGHLKDKHAGAFEGIVGTGALPQLGPEYIDITGGKSRRLFVSESSGVALALRRRVGSEEQLVLNFRSDAFALTCSRCPHLAGREIIIGRSQVVDGKVGTPTFSWDEIYVD